VNEAIDPAYDRERLIELFGNDPKTLAEVEREFVGTAREAEREMADTGDLAVVARAAHRVKGASGMIGARTLHKIAEALERAAKSGDQPGVRRLQTVFSQEVKRVAEQAGLAS
jgi:HPt (histidine-containing phosphotransfer) domain-containing protein